MTEKIDYSKLTDSEIDELMATKTMGWDHSNGAYWKPYEEDKDELVYLEKNWHPSSDLNQAWECEDELLKTVIDDTYDGLLSGVLIMYFGYGTCSTFHAPAHQRCIAILMAMEGENDTEL